MRKIPLNLDVRLRADDRFRESGWTFSYHRFNLFGTGHHELHRQPSRPSGSNGRTDYWGPGERGGNAAHPGQSRPRPARYPSDPRLVQACLHGSPEAWNELIERYQRLVYVVPRQYAENVMQNVFPIVFRRLHTLRDHSTLPAWMMRIPYRATFLHGKHGRRQVGCLANPAR